MIARINELPIQCLRSSLLQRWLQRTAPNNICQPGGSCEEAFLCLPLVLQSCHLRSPCFLLRTVYFSMVFLFWILELPIMPFSPYLCSFTLFLCTALFCVGFSSSCHQVSRFLRSLSWGCKNTAVCMLDLGSQTAEPLQGGLQGQQVTLENYWHSLLKSHHFHCQITSLQGSREQKHTLNKIKEPLCISFNSDTAVRAAEDSLLGSSDHTKADRST